ncbi:basic phospholipase A2 CoaTx-II-like [Passerculus sandwichensis]
MNSLLGLSVLFVWGLSPAHGSLLQLHQMISQATGKNAFVYYGFYGCYCGLGGRGQPKDATDRCCQLHDACYDSLLRHDCDAKARPYYYSWRHGRLCCGEYGPARGGAIPPRPGLTLGSPCPAGQGSRCDFLSCECDRSLALCLRRNAWSYQRRYRFYPNWLCR